jgi:hypothetical protein
MWNVKNLYRIGSLKSVTSEMLKYNFGLVAIQEFRWGMCGIQPANGCTLFHENGKANRHIGTSFSYIRESDQ